MLAHPAPKLVMPVAVFGKDDRVVLPQSRKTAASAIGLLVDIKSKAVCTAFCVGDRIVATAAHCLFKTSGEQPPRLADFRFRRALTQSRGEARIEGADQGTGLQNISAGSTRLSVKPPIDATEDWALVRLAAPVCTGARLPLSERTPDEVLALAAAGRVYQIAYHRDFKSWQPAYGAACPVKRDFGAADWQSIARDFSAPDRLILHTCDTGGASSGSPLLVDGLNGPEVVGINVGTYVQSKVMMQNGEVVERLGADTVANTGLSAAPIAVRLAAFKRARILSQRTFIARLERDLAKLGLYQEAPTGRYSEALRMAIEAFEASRGLERTGIASEELLLRVAAELAPGETSSIEPRR
jgi:protease YdgD